MGNMTEINTNSYNSLPPSEENNDDSDMQAFIARMEAAYKGLESKKDKLTSLYEKGDQQALDEEIDAIVDVIANHNPENNDNLKRLRELRNYRSPGPSITEEIDQITNRQKKLYADFRVLVVNEAGLPDETRFTEIEASRNAIGATLESAFPDGVYTSTDALKTLGIINVDENDKENYSFPSKLVPESTDELWKTYLASVCKHVKTVEDLKLGTSDQGSVEQADRTRTFAHNAVTKELHAILNLQPTDNWENKNTRKLIASMRDQVFPSKEAALSVESMALLESHLANLDASEQLSSH
ncbi:MAG: hypothetical protein JWM07_449 [Candidatus Saccharibacteria bacterium]|jgi:hypothetical protein|nr:hypothetical protein [Candidatus Saccharibacteria bacterium]